MELVATIVCGALSLGVFGCTIGYVVLFFCNTEEFHRINAIDRRLSRSVRYRHCLFLGLAAAGIGIAIYHGVTSSFWWVPGSWTRTTEDGDPEWIVHGPAMMLAVFGTAFILERMNAIADQMLERRRSTRSDSETSRNSSPAGHEVPNR